MAEKFPNTKTDPVEKSDVLLTTPRRSATLRRAFLTTLPVMTGYLVLSMGFGVILRTRGFGVWWAFAMSATIYAGSMQYAALDLISGGVSLVTTALTTLAINARHLFYGIAMVDRYRHAKWKPLLLFTLTDENYSLLCNATDVPDRERYDRYVSLLNYSYWLIGSVIGNLLGTVLPFSTEGIDFALTALFLTVFVEQWLHTKDHVPAIIGGGSALVCLLLFGKERFLIPTMVCIALFLTVLRKRLDRGEDA